MKEEGTEGDYIEDIDGEVAVDRWVSMVKGEGIRGEVGRERT